MLRATRSIRSKVVYELRTYSILPKHFPAYLQLTNKLFHLRTAHSKLCGFWVTEIGGQNEVVHVWEYDSLEHRKDVREALAQDANWGQEYLSNARQFFDKQDNKLMVYRNFEGIGDFCNTTGPYYYFLLEGGKNIEAIPSEIETLVTFKPLICSNVEDDITICRSSSLQGLLQLGPLCKPKSCKLMTSAALSSMVNATWH